ncbi:ATP-binding protein [Streptomyces sp. 147326]|uniref:ATP-binding protein n=1 Tax=Streptomyces sp. 147326 TaxID=3074379 RepID=UPI003857500D
MNRQTALLEPEASRHVTASITQDPTTVSAGVEIPSDMKAASAARRFAAAKLDEWGCTELEDDALLICSELATNAVVHGRTKPEGHNEHIRLDLTWRPGNALIIQVEDNSTAQPTPSNSAPSAESGRGLGLVASLADQWSFWLNRDGRGKRVWVCLRPQ